MSEPVIVIGAGVIGLSSALHLIQQGHSVTIVAKDFPVPFETLDAVKSINYTSPWGGAHNRWVPPTSPDEERDHQLSLVTFEHMSNIATSNPESGVQKMKGIEYLENPPPQYRSLTEEKAQQLGLKGFKRLSQDSLPAGAVWGCEYDTWCVNPMVYCMYLLRQIFRLGGKTIVRDLRTPEEVFAIPGLSNVKTVVNCSGIGFHDPDVFPTRGQTCLVANQCSATVTRQNADGSWTFCVPRPLGGGTIIGGTKEPNDWSTTPSESVRNALLSKFIATWPNITKDGPLRVLKDIVGRRPTRHGGLRLSKEKLGADKSIVHAYGLGGRGYELSWGVAQQVGKLVGQDNKSRL